MENPPFSNQGNTSNHAWSVFVSPVFHCHIFRNSIDQDVAEKSSQVGPWKLQENHDLQQDQTKTHRSFTKKNSFQGTSFLFKHFFLMKYVFCCFLCRWPCWWQLLVRCSNATSAMSNDGPVGDKMIDVRVGHHSYTIILARRLHHGWLVASKKPCLLGQHDHETWPVLMLSKTVWTNVRKQGSKKSIWICHGHFLMRCVNIHFRSCVSLKIQPICFSLRVTSERSWLIKPVFFRFLLVSHFICHPTCQQYFIGIH